MLPTRLITWKDNVVRRFTLVEGIAFQDRIPLEGLVSDIFVRIDATFTNGSSTVATLDGFSRLLQRIAIDCDGDQLLNVNPTELFLLNNIWNGTQNSFLQVATSGAGLSPFVVFHIPCSLPKPFPQMGDYRHATALPAALIKNVNFRIEPQNDIEGSILSTVGTGALTAITVSIVARTAMLTTDEVRKHVQDSYGMAHFLDTVDQVAAAAVEQELRIKSGRGVLTGYYTRNAADSSLTSVASNTVVTTTRFVVGQSDVILDSRFRELQDASKSRFNVETMPVGSYFHSFAPDGDLKQGIPMVGVNDVRLLQTFNGSLTNAFQHVISQTLAPGFYTRFLS